MAELAYVDGAAEVSGETSKQVVGWQDLGLLIVDGAWWCVKTEALPPQDQPITITRRGSIATATSWS